MMLILLALSMPAAFLLSGIGSALLNVSRVRARHAAEEGDRAAVRLVRLLQHRNELHHAVTLLHHLCALAAFVCCLMLLVGWFGVWGWFAAIVLVLPLFLIALEYVPKLLFRRYPFRMLRRFAVPLALLRLLAAPWIWGAAILKRKAGEGTEQNELQSLQVLAETVSRLNVLPPAICTLVQRAARLQKLQAGDLAMPLTQLMALPPDMPLTSAVALNAQPQHPWRAVLAPDGRLLGWLDMIALPAKPSGDRLVRQFMRPLLQTRATDRALRCLQSLRKRAEPVAAVLNAQGDVIGVLTQRDLLESIFDAKP